MEKIKALCRMILAVSLTVLLLSFTSYIFHSQEKSDAVYDTMVTQFQEIEKKLQMEEGTLSQIIQKDTFIQGIDETKTKEIIVTMIKNTKQSVLYEDETLNQVADQMLLMYQNQKALMHDAIYEKTMNELQIGSGIGILFSGAVLLFAQRKTKRKEASV